MKNKIPYKSLDSFVLRTPIFPFDLYEKLTLGSLVKDSDLLQFCKDPTFREALFLASPTLYSEMNKWLGSPDSSSSKYSKLKQSILKYISRMTSRCTPFGLFAGCTLGHWGDRTQIELCTPDKHARHTRIDMNYLVALAQDLASQSSIRKHLLFYPNSSIYKAGEHIRYIEYYYTNGSRNHQITEVSNNEYLQKVLNRARSGTRLVDLAQCLVDGKICFEESHSFVEELADSQLLVSELEPSVSGPEFLDQILKILQGIPNATNTYNQLKEIANKLDEIDMTIGNDPGSYSEISDVFHELETKFDQKYLYQTDLELKTNYNNLDRKILSEVRKGLLLLNRITLARKGVNFSNFKDKFIERYETKEIPLATVLDVEMGIGYADNRDSGGNNPLIDGLVIPPRKDIAQNQYQLSKIDLRIQDLLNEALVNDKYVIEIKEDDFSDLDANWVDLPDSFSSMVELYEEGGDVKIKFSGAGGSSAANLMGRFCHGDEDLSNYVQQIAHMEDKMNPVKLLAEIVHLPEARAGNILLHPDFRPYEIPYLANSSKPRENQLGLDDLVVSVGSNRKIELRSRKHNKEVLPRLTNAHNYSAKSLPIYHFLCDMQFESKRNAIFFSFGPLANQYVFLPRVEYGRLILHLASWNLRKKHIEHLFEIIDDDDLLAKEIEQFRSRFKMPELVLFTEGDNELLINLENLSCVRLLLNMCKKRNSVQLREFIKPSSRIVKDQNGNRFTNQVIMSFYNKEKLNDPDYEFRST